MRKARRHFWNSKEGLPVYDAPSHAGAWRRRRKMWWRVSPTRKASDHRTLVDGRSAGRESSYAGGDYKLMPRGGELNSHSRNPRSQLSRIAGKNGG
ncbi:hypothetical protein LguiA_021204 [Lonicera macranthoides]